MAANQLLTVFLIDMDRYFPDDIDTPDIIMIRVHAHSIRDEIVATRGRSHCESQGIITKYRYGKYRSGPGDWLEVKCIRSGSFIVIGYEQSKSRVVA